MHPNCTRILICCVGRETVSSAADAKLYRINWTEPSQFLQVAKSTKIRLTMKSPAPKTNWNKVLEEQWGHPLTHESGHALAAILQGIPCYGIYWKKGVGTGKFCALSPDPTEYDRKYFVFLAAGSAAELLTYGSYDEDAARSDRVPFERSDAPSYEEAVKEAQELLSQNKRTLKRLVSMLKATCLRADLNISSLPERGMDGTEDRFNELMPEADLREAIARK